MVARTAEGVIRAYMPNPGRLSYLKSGTRMLFMKRRGKGKLPYEAFLAYEGRTPIVVDSRLANRVFKTCVSKGYLPEFKNCSIEREVLVRGKRIDFLLHCDGGDVYVEVKSCTHVEEGVAKFPDRPTERGRGHLLLLKELQESGRNCAVVFVIERPDALVFSPYREIDQEFAEILKDAQEKGVKAIAFSTMFDTTTNTLLLERMVKVTV